GSVQYSGSRSYPNRPSDLMSNAKASLRSWLYSSSRFASNGASAGVAVSRATVAGSITTFRQRSSAGARRPERAADRARAFETLDLANSREGARISPAVAGGLKVCSALMVSTHGTPRTLKHRPSAWPIRLRGPRPEGPRQRERGKGPRRG